ncbi:MAG: response regulator transcription factor [Verrucomicrobiae bacterium]|nr:response regulator transcription factor [Verrucomicrobiae bacterium]
MTRLLIIEDDEQTRENLQIILNMEGYAVSSAGDGRDGLKLAQSERPALIICDVSMPEMDGHEVLRQLRNDPKTAEIPFIFLTAQGERHQQRAGMNMGADDYLCKPLDAEDLLAAVRARLQRKRENRDAALADAGPDFSSSTPLESLGLTVREAEVLLWVAQGKANADVATILGMSEKTVKIHLGHIFEKLNVETRTAAAMIAIEKLLRARGTSGP